MKKYLYLMLIIFLFFTFFTNCEINSSTGLILIINLTDKDFTVKIVDISLFVAKGAPTQEGKEATFKLNYGIII